MLRQGVGLFREPRDDATMKHLVTIPTKRFVNVICGTLAASLLIAAGSAAAKPDKDIRLQALATYDSSSGEGGAEIAVFDSVNELVLVTNGAENRIDIFPFFGGAPSFFDLSAFGGGVQSIAVSNGLAAAAVAADPVVLPGSVVFFDPANPGAGASAVVPVGALPDMVTFNFEGTQALVANEGEPRCIDGDGNGVTDPTQATDPEGSISIIDIAGGAPVGVTTVGFSAFNGMEAALQAEGVRVGTWPGATVAEELEPEYIAVAKDGKTAYVTLQENNALAIVDVRAAAVTDIVGLPLKDHSLATNSLDASDRDDQANIREWPTHGMSMPDSIASWKSKGKTYTATANEGDGREYYDNADNDDGGGAALCFIDEARVKDVTQDAGFPLPADIPTIDDLQEDENLGRLKMTRFFPSEFYGGTPPTDDTDPADVPGLTYTKLASYGARSVSIWDENGNLVWDSGDQFANKILATIGEDAWVNGPVIGTEGPPDNRSDDKGAEPEAVAAGKAYGRNLLFVGLERAGGVMTLDATDPTSPTLLEWVQTADIAPEGIQFVKEDESPTDNPLLIVSYEVTGTTTVFEVLKDE
jgi:DNA-binding beta-propeller fold protein YncE